MRFKEVAVLGRCKSTVTLRKQYWERTHHDTPRPDISTEIPWPAEVDLGALVSDGSYLSIGRRCDCPSQLIICILKMNREPTGATVR